LGWSFTFGESQMIPSYSGTSYWFKVRDEFSRNYFRWKGHAKAVVTDKGRLLIAKLLAWQPVFPNVNFKDSGIELGKESK
jgi:phosphoenolpyruvate synthase/pyruvate phosphate dikinase